ncbi:hypothetical protein AAES_71741 [Amazona aestiva]|uniref:Uncharacterized protein n=1 Tax=Amazona aestiva TaxID=12930 RepID=A0A0Q3MJI3_AMAAE|nr:hypothetical protein AAES_71741 [Amazona aestiva]
MRWYKNLISCVTGNTDRNEMVQEADKLRGRVTSSNTNRGDANKEYHWDIKYCAFGNLSFGLHLETP